MCFKIIFYVLALLSVLIFQVEGFFKIKRVECKSLDEKFFKVQTCTLKAINRNVAEFTLKGLLLEKLTRSKIRVEILKKYNVYRNFLFNYTVDACEFIAKRKKYPVFNVLYEMFGRYTNMNHTCPYEGFLIIEKYATKHEDLLLPLPSGEYRLDVDWYWNDVYRFVTKVWFAFEELNKNSGTRTYEILH